MRDVTDTWLEYIEQTSEKTLVKCLRVEAKDNVIYGTTTHTRDFIFEGVTYYTSLGLLDTANARTEGFSVDNMEFTMALSPAMHSAVEAGKFDGARCYLFLVDFTDLDKGSIPISTGYIGEITRDEGIVKAEILGLMSRLGRKTGRVYTIECDAILGDVRCKVPMEDVVITREFTLTASGNIVDRIEGNLVLDGFRPGDKVSIQGSTLGNNGTYVVDGFLDQYRMDLIEAITADETAILTVTRVVNRIFSKTVASVEILSPRRLFAMSDNLDSLGNTLDNQWLFAGVVEFTTGDNAGEKRDVSSHIGVDLECYLEFPYDIQVGDAFKVSTGCDLLFTTCRDKFDNITNHRGFPFCPTNEELFYSPAQTE
jgi:uncharacterized phage protein (TIGR02218 family)